MGTAFFDKAMKCIEKHAVYIPCRSGSFFACIVLMFSVMDPLKTLDSLEMFRIYFLTIHI
jgi:hypothetical protein